MAAVSKPAAFKSASKASSAAMNKRGGCSASPGSRAGITMVSCSKPKPSRRGSSRYASERLQRISPVWLCSRTPLRLWVLASMPRTVRVLGLIVLPLKCSFANVAGRGKDGERPTRDCRTATTRRLAGFCPVSIVICRQPSSSSTRCIPPSATNGIGACGSTSKPSSRSVFTPLQTPAGFFTSM